MKLKIILYLLLFFSSSKLSAQSNYLLDTLQKVFISEYKEFYNCTHKKEKKRYRFCWNYKEYLSYDVERKYKIDSFYHFYKDFNFNSADSIIIYESIADEGGFMSTLIAIDTNIYTVMGYSYDTATNSIIPTWKKSFPSDLNINTKTYESMMWSNMLWFFNKLETDSWKDKYTNDDFGICGGSHSWITKIIRLGNNEYQFKSDYIRN